jgi:hypothetical protein
MKTGKVRLNVTWWRFWVAVVAVEKKLLTYSECVFVALVIQHAKRIHCIILPSVACLAVPYFFHIDS